MTAQEIVARALELPQGERAEIVQQLLLSLDPAEPDEVLDEIWRAEIEARLSAYERGEMETSSWEDVAARIRMQLSGIDH